MDFLIEQCQLAHNKTCSLNTDCPHLCVLIARLFRCECKVFTTRPECTWAWRWQPCRWTASEPAYCALAAAQVLLVPLSTAGRWYIQQQLYSACMRSALEGADWSPHKAFVVLALLYCSPGPSSERLGETEGHSSATLDLLSTTAAAHASRHHVLSSEVLVGCLVLDTWTYSDN